MQFAFPLSVGGAPPVSVVCSALPGAAFPVGTTTVTCTATDSIARQASCGFTVTVRPAPQVSRTSFLAFGDSITEGTISNPLPGLFSLGLSHSYPFKLNDLFLARYRVQNLSLINAGMPGEVAAAALSPEGRKSGEVRLREELQRYNPQVLLLMEGTNDLFFGLEDGITYGIPALDRMIGEAMGRGTQVFLATIPPQRADGVRRRGAVAALIPSFNDKVKALAAARGAVLVDVFAALNVDLHRYIGDDDLHPTDAGFSLIAATFMAAIQMNLEGNQQPSRVR